VSLPAWQLPLWSWRVQQRPHLESTARAGAEKNICTHGDVARKASSHAAGCGIWHGAECPAEVLKCGLEAD